MKKEVFDMYDEVELGSNKNCNSCKSLAKNKLAGPISVFHIGSNFNAENNKYKIIFVGKNSWYDKKDLKKEKVEGKNFADVTKNGRCSLYGCENKRSAYWKYIRAIIEKIYGNLDNGIENISITNIIKCNTTGVDGEPSDKTPKNIIDNCICFGIFEKEIETLKPKHIIFLTGKSYDDYIKKFNFGKLVEGSSKKGKKDGGKIVWWEREFLTDERKIKVLRTSHPQGKHKKPFVEGIVKWIETKS